MKNDNTRVIALLVFYDSRKLLIFKLLGVVVNLFLDKYFSIEYYCIQKEKKLYLSHKGFEYTSFHELSGIGIPEILINIVSCYGFIQQVTSTLILTSRSKLVSCYISKGFMILAQHYQTLYDTPIRVKQLIHVVCM